MIFSIGIFKVSKLVP
jgi:hypothetical protein